MSPDISYTELAAVRESIPCVNSHFPPRKSGTHEVGHTSLINASGFEETNVHNLTILNIFRALYDNHYFEQPKVNLDF